MLDAPAGAAEASAGVANERFHGVDQAPGAGARSEELRDRVASLSWYHTIELPGDVRTPGNFDTARELAHLPFPESLEGMRCLDVATADGFWAFEMERRGASEVLAVDVRPERMDWPGNADARPVPAFPQPEGETGFEIAHEALKSQVKWRELSAYDLTPEDIGEFDFVFIGSVLMHLRDPVAALAAIGSVLRGKLLSVDAISPRLTLQHPRRPMASLEAPGWPLWWVPNLSAYRALFPAAKLEVVDTGRPFFVKRRPAYVGPYVANEKVRRSAVISSVKTVVLSRLGNLHSWVYATPA
jgi:tRNA (mo5U34)-methyltransferase